MALKLLTLKELVTSYSNVFAGLKLTGYHSWLHLPVFSVLIFELSKQLGKPVIPLEELHRTQGKHRELPAPSLRPNHNPDVVDREIDHVEQTNPSEFGAAIRELVSDEYSAWMEEYTSDRDFTIN